MNSVMERNIGQSLGVGQRAAHPRCRPPGAPFPIGLHLIRDVVGEVVLPLQTLQNTERRVGEANFLPVDDDGLVEVLGGQRARPHFAQLEQLIRDEAVRVHIERLLVAVRAHPVVHSASARRFGVIDRAEG